jgi:hypothetical protein
MQIDSDGYSDDRLYTFADKMQEAANDMWNRMRVEGEEKIIVDLSTLKIDWSLLNK